MMRLLVYVLCLWIASSTLTFARYYSPGDSTLYVYYTVEDQEGTIRSYFYRFHDGGAWVDRTVNDSINADIVTCDRIPGTIYSSNPAPDATTYGTVSRDFGETWEEINAPFRRVYAGFGIAGENAGESFVLDNDLWMYHTQDSWETYDSIFVNTPDTVYVIDLFQANGHLLGKTEDTRRFCFSPDTGRTWGVGYRNPNILNTSLSAGVPDELWGYRRNLEVGYVYFVSDSGATLDTIYITHFPPPEDPTGWNVSVIPTDNAGEIFVYGDVRHWFPVLEIKVYHIKNYGADLDSFHYYFPFYEIQNSGTSFPIPEVLVFSAYPNPFNPTTTISFDLTKKSDVKLNVFDVTGRLTSTLINESMIAGRHEVVFDGAGLPSGIYFARLQAEGFVQTEKMVLLK